MSTYKVKTNLKHDGKIYPKGSEVELNDETASRLINGGVIVDPKADVEEESKEEIQPAVNNVEREGGDVEGEAKVTPGADNQPTGDDEDDDKDALKSEYKVLQRLEYPKGTIHEVDAVLELEEEVAGSFGEGLIKKVEDNL